MKYVVYTSLVSAAITFGFVFVFGIFNIIAPVYLNTILAVCALTFMACAFVLWINGWYILLKYWNFRSSDVNLILFAFMLIGNIFAGYYMYMRKEDSLV